MSFKNKQKVYKYHLSFLNKFPDLSDWLSLNGFTINHSHRDFAMNMIYSYWSDYTLEPDDCKLIQALNSLVMIYNMSSNEIEVFYQINAKNPHGKGELIDELGLLIQRCGEAQPFKPDINSDDFMTEESEII